MPRCLVLLGRSFSRGRDGRDEGLKWIRIFVFWETAGCFVTCRGLLMIRCIMMQLCRDVLGNIYVIKVEDMARRY